MGIIAAVVLPRWSARLQPTTRKWFSDGRNDARDEGNDGRAKIGRAVARHDARHDGDDGQDVEDDGYVQPDDEQQVRARKKTNRASGSDPSGVERVVILAFNAGGI